MILKVFNLKLKKGVQTDLKNVKSEFSTALTHFYMSRENSMKINYDVAFFVGKLTTTTNTLATQLQVNSKENTIPQSRYAAIFQLLVHLGFLGNQS